MRAYEELRNVDIRTVDKSSLTDIKDIRINTGASVETRIKSFIEQVANPYCMIVDGIVVKFSFSDTEETMGDKLKRYFQSKVG